MNEQLPIPPRQRLKEILAIPERLRTDAQWDELNELEIALASVNRTDTQESGMRRKPPVNAERQKPSGTPQGKKPPRKFHKRPPKANTP